MNLAWTAGSNGTRFGIAAKYQLDSSASLSVSSIYWILLPFKEKKSKCSLKFGGGIPGVFYFFYNSMFCFKAKVNNASLVGIGYTQTLRPGTEDPSLTLVTTENPFNHNLYLIKLWILSFMPGMKVTLSALVDGKNINAGGHKLGLGLELEA